MRFIDNRGVTDPRINLALEEYVLRHVEQDDTFLLFYINEPSIIIGRNQNTLEEINHEYVRDHGIHVVRRISGGGAVYHDLGNLNFSIIAPYSPERFNRYDEFTRPVVEVLRTLGVPAELSGRNDIVAGGRKISGNAQFSTGKRMFSHGTVLFDSKLDDVVAALNVKMGKIESKGLKSVRSRVANISEFLARPLEIAEFRGLILERIFGSRSEIPTLELSDADWEAVRDLSARKYATWEWNYGQSPEFNVQKTRRFPAGEIDLRIDVQQGRISSLRIFGDFMGSADVAALEAILRGVRYEPEELAGALRDVAIEEYFGPVAREEFLELLYG
jgi:lipoate-protein ligase A